MTAPNLSVCTVSTASGNVITAKGRMAYVHLYKATLPQGETDQSKARFQASLVFPKGTDLAVLNQAVEAAAVAAWGPEYKSKYKVKKPFLKTEEYPKLGLKADEFPFFIRANSPSKPQVIRADRSNVGDDKQDEVYSGRWARFTLRPYTYDHKTGGKGVSLGLQNVQLLDHDEPLAAARPAADTEFEAVGEVGSAPGGTDALFE